MTLRRLSACLAAATAALLPPARAADEPVTPVNTTITSDGPGEMVSSDKETTISFRQNVVVVGTNLRLTCDALEVVVIRKGDPTATLGKIDKFRSLLATGNVRIIQGDREAACGRAEVLPGENRIVLTGGAVVVDRGSEARIVGEKITLLRGERRVIVEQPTLTGPPIKDLGFDKNPPPPAAPAPSAPEPPKQP